MGFLKKIFRKIFYPMLQHFFMDLLKEFRKFSGKNFLRDDAQDFP
jgi:hypothetical protein